MNKKYEVNKHIFRDIIKYYAPDIGTDFRFMSKASVILNSTMIMYSLVTLNSYFSFCRRYST